MRGKALKNYGTVAALVVIIGIFGLLRPASFFTLKNFLNITRQAAPLAIIALGATFVMTVNEFDLSIGNIVSLGGVIAALLSIRGVSVPVCFLAAVAVGIVVGGVNGVIRREVRDPFFYHNTWDGNGPGRRDLRTYRWNDRI